jgi:hypothetical protein
MKPFGSEVQRAQHMAQEGTTTASSVFVRTVEHGAFGSVLPPALLPL